MGTRGTSNNVPSRNPPLYSLDIWSASHYIRLKLPKATNTAGSWHTKLNRITSPHPGINHTTNVINKLYFINI